MVEKQQEISQKDGTEIKATIRSGTVEPIDERRKAEKEYLALGGWDVQEKSGRKISGNRKVSREKQKQGIRPKVFLK